MKKLDRLSEYFTGIMMIKRPQPDNKLWQETKIRTVHSLWLESLRNHDDGEETVKNIILILYSKTTVLHVHFTGTFLGRPQQDKFYGEHRHTPWDTHSGTHTTANFFLFLELG